MIIGEGGGEATAALFANDAGAKGLNWLMWKGRDLLMSWKPAISSLRLISGKLLIKKGGMTPIGMQGIWLDTPLIEARRGKRFIQRYYRHLYHWFKEYDIDFAKESVLVYPSQHYQNGGVLTHATRKTDIPHLYAV